MVRQQQGFSMATLINILIADDQPYLQDVLSHDLGGGKCHLVGLRNTKSVKEYVIHSKPDLVLLEPSVNGFEGWEVLMNSKNG